MLQFFLQIFGILICKSTTLGLNLIQFIPQKKLDPKTAGYLFWEEPRAGAFGRMLPTPDGEGTRLIPATPQKGDGVWTLRCSCCNLGWGRHTSCLVSSPGFGLGLDGQELSSPGVCWGYICRWNWCVAPTLWQFPSKSVAALNKLKVITLSVLLEVLDFPETPRWLSPPVSTSSGISRWVVACVAGSELSWVAGSDRATQRSQPCNSSSNFQQPSKNYHGPSRDQPYSFTILSCSFLRLLSVFCRCLCHLLKIKDNKKIQ